MGQDTSPGEDRRSAPDSSCRRAFLLAPWGRKPGEVSLSLKVGLPQEMPSLPRQSCFFFFFFFSYFFGELRFGPLIHTLNSTCSKAITQDALNKVGICLALHKPFTVSWLFALLALQF